MSRQRLVFLVAAILPISSAPLSAQGQKSVEAIAAPVEHSRPGPDVEPSPPKLVFAYPCSISYSNGERYEERVMDWECDYIHATVKGGKEALNRLPTVAAQKAFLDSVRDTSEEAHTEYMKKVAALLKISDPAKVLSPKTTAGKTAPLSTGERMKRIAALNVMLSSAVFEAATPFLWPPRDGESYVEKTAGSWPESWRPYLQPIYARIGELDSLLKTDEVRLIDQADASLDAKLRRTGLGAAAATPLALDKVFDGGGSHADAVAGALGGSKPSPNGATIKGSIPLPLSDLKTAPPPIPTDEAARDQRSYFARGYAAGAKRLKDDATIALWHAAGQTRTIGDPYGKASLTFRQEGPSCAVSSEFEALRARGINVKIEDLAREGLDKGYFVDYGTKDGARGGGTPWGHLDALLNDHGVKSSSVVNATPRELDQAVRRSGDAIVYVVVKGFWNDPKLPDRATHAVYVTGEEVDGKGAVRGYYVNDTGTGEGARFISADDFAKVWTKNLVVIHDAPKK